MNKDDIDRPVGLGITTNEIWCAIAESEPWTRTLTIHDARE